MSILRSMSKFTAYKDPENKKYEWAYNVQQKIQDMQWTIHDVIIGEDIYDYVQLPESDQNFIKNILRLFTQNDVQALTGYVKIMNLVKPIEILMMLTAEANTEVIHVDAYSQLTDSLGLDSSFYQDFYNIPVMERKIDYLEKAKVKKYEEYKAMGLSDIELDKKYRRDVLRMVAVYAGGLEGIELMAEFMLLLSYQQLGLFKGMCQINDYSIKDESVHCMANSRLFLELKEENSDVYDAELELDIINAIKQIVEQEFAMLDYLYANGTHPLVDKETAKSFVMFMANRALTYLELPKQYNIDKNPVPFLDEILSAVEFSNFFESAVTAYSKGAVDLDGYKELRDSKDEFFKELKQQTNKTLK